MYGAHDGMGKWPLLIPTFDYIEDFIRCIYDIFNFKTYITTKRDISNNDDYEMTIDHKLSALRHFSSMT